MPKPIKNDKLGRDLRQDDWQDLGEPTQEAAVAAIDDGKLEDAKALMRYMIPEGKALHDLMCDWVWDLLTQIAKRRGEQEMFECLRDSQSGWMLRRTWKGFLNLTVAERVQITAEIADNDDLRAQGLMNRDSLAENHGMLFVYGTAQVRSFWMRNTRIPLDIAFIDGNGVIINIEQMEPQSDQNYYSQGPMMYALEMTQGWFEANGVGPGDRLEF